MRKNFKLYRHFDCKNTLLYVGLSVAIQSRLSEHARNSKWFDRVTTITIENYSSMETLRKAERKAIETEEPLYNKIFSRRIQLTKNSELGLKELSIYLEIPEGRLRREMQLQRFPIKPDSHKPYKWLKWRIDLHSMKPEIKNYLQKLKQIETKS